MAIGAYLAAGLLGAAIPANAGWRAPDEGVTIWVEDNGIHTGIVMPKVAAGVDWRGDFPAGDLADPRYGGHGYVALGWGERNFYLGTPTWWDVRPWVVIRAALGSDATVLHVEHVARPLLGERVRAVTLRPEEYRRLAALIRASRADGAALHGYGGWDAFYPGRGHYSAVHTCNDWTGRMLRGAGVRAGRWTPFSPTVFWWL